MENHTTKWEQTKLFQMVSALSNVIHHLQRSQASPEQMGEDGRVWSLKVKEMFFKVLEKISDEN